MNVQVDWLDLEPRGFVLTTCVSAVNKLTFTLLCLRAKFLGSGSGLPFWPDASCGLQVAKLTLDPWRVSGLRLTRFDALGFRRSAKAGARWQLNDMKKLWHSREKTANHNLCGRLPCLMPCCKTIRSTSWNFLSRCACSTRTARSAELSSSSHRCAVYAVKGQLRPSPHLARMESHRPKVCASHFGCALLDMWTKQPNVRDISRYREITSKLVAALGRIYPPSPADSKGERVREDRTMEQEEARERQESNLAEESRNCQLQGPSDSEYSGGVDHTMFMVASKWPTAMVHRSINNPLPQ